jgi:hypothetical protein
VVSQVQEQKMLFWRTKSRIPYPYRFIGDNILVRADVLSAFEFKWCAYNLILSPSFSSLN